MDLTGIFLKLFNMSITASWIVLAVIILRFVLKKAPKWIFCLLWALVGIRLVCPFSFESVLSLIPSSETVPQNIMYSKAPVIDSGIDAVDTSLNPVISEAFAPNTAESGNPLQILIFIISVVWIIGLSLILLYGAVSYIRLKLRVAASVKREDNIYICDSIDTPFILGVFAPKIYLPSNIGENDSTYVIAHEKAHLKRLDHLWKPIGFLLLSVYWFNPVLWVAYIFLCKDIEIACDQKVIDQMGEENKKAYSTALLDCSIKSKLISACPLAFGEVGVKQRIKAVLNYKKPAFWISITAIIALIVASVCFLTNPKSEKWESDNLGINGTVSVAECDNVEYKYILGTLNEESPYIEVQWINRTDKTICFGQEYKLYKNDIQCKLSNGYGWDSLLNTVNPNGNMYEMYHLNCYGKLEAGSYRIEKEFWFQDEEETKYTASVKFTVGTQYSFIGKHYVGERVICSWMLSSYFYTEDNIPNFAVTEGDFHLTTSDFPQPTYFSSLLYDLGELKKVKLKKDNFDDLIDSSISWEDGYSAKFLRANNLNAFFVADYENNNMYYLLEQKNGEIYIAKGYTDINKIRWIFKMKEIEKTATEEIESSEEEPISSNSSQNDVSSSTASSSITYPNEENDRNVNPIFNATVLEVYESSVLVEPFEDSEIRKNSSRIVVSTDVLSTNPVPELRKGSKIRVVYNGQINEVYPPTLGTVFAIYLLNENDEVVTAQKIYNKEVSGITLLYLEDKKQAKFKEKQFAENDLEKEKQVRFKEKQFTENIIKYFNTYHCVPYDEGGWVKFNPGSPDKYVFGIDFSDGTSAVINIFFDFYGEDSRYYVAIADSDKPFDKDTDYSDFNYQRYVISQDFQRFLFNLIE